MAITVEEFLGTSARSEKPRALTVDEFLETREAGPKPAEGVMPTTLEGHRQRAAETARRRLAAVERFGGAPLKEAVAGVGRAGLSAVSLAARPFSKRAADYYLNLSEDLNEDLAATRSSGFYGKLAGWWGGAFETIPTAMLAAPAGPAGVATLFGAEQWNSALKQGEDAGLEGSDLHKYAAAKGAIEAGITIAFNKVLGGGLEGLVAGKAVAAKSMKEYTKKAAKSLAFSEYPEEVLIDFLQNATDISYGLADPSSRDFRNPDGSLYNEKDGLSPQLSRMADVLGATITTMGVAHAPNIGSHAVSKFIDSPSRGNYNKLPKDVKVAGNKPSAEERDQLADDFTEAREFGDAVTPRTGTVINTTHPHEKNDPELDQGVVDPDDPPLMPEEDYIPSPTQLDLKVGQIDEKQAKENSRLAVPVVSEETRELHRQINQAQERTRTQMETSVSALRAEADGRLQKDYEGRLDHFLQKFGKPVPLDHIETYEMQQLLEREYAKGLRGDRGAMAAAIRLNRIWESAGTVQALAFQARQDRAEGPAARRKKELERMFLRGSPRMQAEIGAAFDRLQKARKTGNEREIGIAMKSYNRKTDKLQKQLQKDMEELAVRGYDFSRLDKYADSFERSLAISKELQIRRASFGDKLEEYWTNAILSSPRGAVADMLSLGFTGYKVFGERAVQSLLNLPRKGKWSVETAEMGEFVEVMRAVPAALKDGLKNAFKAFLSERSFIQYQVEGARVTPTSRFNVGGQAAIGGKFGRLVRAMGYGRVMLVDEFITTFTATLEAGAQARRIGLARGLSGATLQNFISQQTVNKKSESWQRSLAVGRSVSFQDQNETELAEWATKTGNQIQRLDIAGIPAGKFLNRFVKTPVRILEQGVLLSPLGLYRLGQEWKDPEKRTKRLAQQILAGSALLAIALTDSDDDDEVGIKFTGSRDLGDFSNPATRNMPRQSMRIGGNWYSYSRIEPFATSLSITIDAYDMIRGGGRTSDILGTGGAFYNLVAEKSYLKSLGDIMKIPRYGAIEGLSRWASNFAASWVPSLARTALAAGREEFTERGIWGLREKDVVAMAIERAKQKSEVAKFIPFVGVAPESVKYDLYGRHIKTSSVGNPSADFVWRLISPINVRKQEINTADALLMRWNMMNPNKEYKPEVPSKTYTVRTAAGPQKWKMTTRQHSDYTRLTGRLFAKFVEENREHLNTERPTERDIKILENMRRRANSAIGKTLFPFFSGQIRDQAQKDAVMLSLEQAVQ